MKAAREFLTVSFHMYNIILDVITGTKKNAIECRQDGEDKKEGLHTEGRLH